MEAAFDGLLVALFLLLPVAGLVAGPIYAPAVFAVAVARLAWTASRQRPFPLADRTLIALAGLFILLAWAGLAWSVAPGRSFGAALQTTAVLPVSLGFVVACRPFPAVRAEKLAIAMSVAFLTGMLILGADRLDGFWLLKLIDGKGVWPTKYNRGIDYFVLILLPTLGFFVGARRWRLAAVLALAAVLTVAAGRNTTAQVALPLAALVAGLAWVAPWAAELLLAGATALLALALPFLLRVVEHFRPLIAPHVKSSGLERLEIWDYLSAHVLQRPFTGWGLWTSRLLPATPAEMAHYQKAAGAGIYPHNQWLELWVETGLPGVLIGLAFALLILARIRRLAAALRPAAYATYVMAMGIASLGFEITTDSWWAALAASAALFALFDRALAMAAVRISPAAMQPAPPLLRGTTHPPADAPEPRRNRQNWRVRARGGR